MKNKGDTIFGITVAAFVVLFLVLIFAFKDEIKKEDDSSKDSFTEKKVYDIKTDNQPLLGDPEAPITIVEYGDYKCPACGYFTNSIFPMLESEYIDTGNVKFIFKNFPFISEDSTRVAIYTEGVYKTLGNDAFWSLNKEIYKAHNDIYKQNDLSNESEDIFTKEFLNDISKDIFEKEQNELIKDVLDNKKFENDVKADINEAKTVDITGTPTLFINGKKVLDSLNYDHLKAAIEEELNTVNGNR